MTRHPSNTARSSSGSIPMAEQTSTAPPQADVLSGEGNTSGFQFRQAIVEMMQRGASDLLLKAGRPPTIRVDGQLQMLSMPPMRPEELKSLAESLMTPRQMKEFVESKEADFGIGVPGIGRFRTNVYQQRGSIAFAF